MNMKKAITSSLVSVFLVSGSLCVFAYEKADTEKKPSIYAEENAKLAIESEDMEDFTLNPDYIEAMKSAQERQKMYDMGAYDEKPVVQDKDSTRAWELSK